MKNIIKKTANQAQSTTQTKPEKTHSELSSSRGSKSKEHWRIKESRRYSRQEQYEHNVERKKSFNRRWCKVTKKERDELNAIFPGRNSFTFPVNFYITTSNNLLARKKNYLLTNLENTNKKESKSSSFQDLDSFGLPLSTIKSAKMVASLFESQSDLDTRWVTDPKFAMYSTYKPRNHFPKRESMNKIVDEAYDSMQTNDSQPDYETEQALKKERITLATVPLAKSRYKTFTPEERPKLDPFKEAKIMCDWLESEDGKRFIALFGRDIAERMAKKIVMNATEYV